MSMLTDRRTVTAVALDRLDEALDRLEEAIAGLRSAVVEVRAVHTGGGDARGS